MSVEQQARRTLRRVALWRLVGACVDLPRALFSWLGSVFGIFSAFLSDVSMAVFYFEQAAAREYRNLTGMDLGASVNDAGRYIGSRPEAFEAAVAERDDFEGDDE